MTDYIPTIGLEIHAELKTQTKMFCNSKNDPTETKANVNICPVCLAHPGTLPVINREAVKHVVRVGVALGGTIADYTEFDRKNYFYPDLPKGYQISQYEFPLVVGGALRGVSITRVHLEEDTASSMHGSTPFDKAQDKPLGAGDEMTGTTTIDFNRSGIPLMELVTEPEIHSAKDAGAFARELQLLLRDLGASDANMENGEMRVEANVSVAKAEGQTFLPSGRSDLPASLGTKVEIKNLNSFRAMERAVAYEIKRQTALLERGEAIAQETRGWDEQKQSTFPQRLKEGSADYRYFPDPDLPSLKLSEMTEFKPGSVQTGLPELPWQRRERYIQMGIKKDDAEMFVRARRIGEFFEEAIRGLTEGSREIQLTANYIANDLINIIRDTAIRDTELETEIPIRAKHFRAIIAMVAASEISSRSAKDLITACVDSDVDPREYAAKHRLFQTSSSASDLDGVIAAVLEQNPSVVADYRAGKASALEYLVGQGMKALRGAVEPPALREAIRAKIER